jgi:hypothetical protein
LYEKNITNPCLPQQNLKKVVATQSIPDHNWLHHKKKRKKAFRQGQEDERIIQRKEVALFFTSKLPELSVASSSSCRSPAGLKLSVLAPSTSLLHTFDANEWVRVERIKNGNCWASPRVLELLALGSVAVRSNHRGP